MIMLIGHRTAWPPKDALAGVRARRGGPGLLRPDGARQDPHGHRPRDRRDLGGPPREVPADRAAGAAARQGQAGGALDRLLADVAKARLLVLDEFGCVPFDVDGARLLDRVVSDSYEEERGIHRQRRVRQMGHGLRRRQARDGHRRPRGAPRRARGVRRTQPQARGVSHAEKVGKVEAAARP